MKRHIEADFERWKDQKHPMPLILRGARQVGKSFIVEKFGKEHFENFVLLNFEQHSEYKDCFMTLEPLKILNAIELVKGVKIHAGKTLLFLDEIQECPRAIMALRYFKEEMPDLHIIAAGSLLEFTLKEEDFRMPVGRIQFKYLRPLSFSEFLDASDASQLRKFFKELSLGQEVPLAVHNKALALVREYIALGGMPAVVSKYLETKSLLDCQDIQNSLLLTYRNDFGKYAGRTPHKHLQTIFTKAPGLVGQWLKFSTLDPEASTVTLRSALEKLCDAGLITMVHTTSGAGLPLISHRNEKKCKFLFLDIGLVKRACNLELELIFNKDLMLMNDGALAEQFVGQELLAYLSKEETNSLFSWNREEKSSSAEIDFLIAVDSWMVPIEVKAGAIGSLRSLKIFLDEKKIPLGIRISELPFSINNRILSIPFYMIEELPRLVKEFYLNHS